MQNFQETHGYWNGARHVIITDHARPRLIKTLLEIGEGRVEVAYDGLARLGQSTDVTIIVDAA
jgi:hypothetical protein